MGSCGSKIPKEHSYTQSRPTYSTHAKLEEVSDDEGGNYTHQYGHSYQQNSSTQQSNGSIMSNDNDNDKSKVSATNRTALSNTRSVEFIQCPTYQKLREMGFDSKLAKEASEKHPVNVNDAMEYAWSKPN